MNDILFIDFNLVACVFLKFGWCKMLNGCVDFSFNIFSLRMTVVSVETLENWRWFLYQLKRWKIEDGLNKTWITSNSRIF